MIEKAARGEDRAADYLSANGYRILKRNFRIRTGEVDIIAVQGTYLVFVEVKTWDQFGRSELSHAIGSRKRNRIRRVAETFLAQNPGFREHSVRFDVLLIQKNVSEIDHIEGAFDGAEG